MLARPAACCRITRDSNGSRRAALPSPSSLGSSGLSTVSTGFGDLGGLTDFAGAGLLAADFAGVEVAGFEAFAAGLPAGAEGFAAGAAGFAACVAGCAAGFGACAPDLFAAAGAAGFAAPDGGLACASSPGAAAASNTPSPRVIAGLIDRLFPLTIHHPISLRVLPPQLQEAFQRPKV